MTTWETLVIKSRWSLEAMSKRTHYLGIVVWKDHTAPNMRVTSLTIISILTQCFRLLKVSGSWGNSAMLWTALIRDCSWLLINKLFANIKMYRKELNSDFFFSPKGRGTGTIHQQIHNGSLLCAELNLLGYISE
jgi:hypothetical protein